MDILIVDDHPLYRQGIAAALSGCFTDATITEAKSSREALDLTSSLHHLRLILLDIDLQGENGLQQLPIFLQWYPNVPIVIISASDNSEYVELAIRHGAKGYLVKSAPTREILHAVNLVLTGGTYLPDCTILPSSRIDLSDPQLKQKKLTRRQIQILLQLEKGRPNKMIAGELGISEATVRTHVTDLLKALGANNRTEAVFQARKNKLL